jgi:hypothetical protein
LADSIYAGFLAGRKSAQAGPIIAGTKSKGRVAMTRPAFFAVIQLVNGWTAESHLSVFYPLAALL